MTGVGLTQTEYFNPRSREGSDQDTYDATTKRGDFNPRSREGSDAVPSASTAETVTFQSALPRGERPGIHPDNERSDNFNPRSREGSDDPIFFVKAY